MPVGHQPLDVRVRDAAAVVADVLDPLALHDAKRGVDLAEAIVEPQPLVGQPAHSVAALVAKRSAHRGEAIVVSDDHPAFAGSDLLVGIEAEHASAPEAADGPLARVATEAFAAVFDERQLVSS